MEYELYGISSVDTDSYLAGLSALATHGFTSISAAVDAAILQFDDRETGNALQFSGAYHL